VVFNGWKLVNQKKKDFRQVMFWSLKDLTEKAAVVERPEINPQGVLSRTRGRKWGGDSVMLGDPRG